MVQYADVPVFLSGSRFSLQRGWWDDLALLSHANFLCNLLFLAHTVAHLGVLAQNLFLWANVSCFISQTEFEHMLFCLHFTEGLLLELPTTVCYTRLSFSQNSVLSLVFCLKPSVLLCVLCHLGLWLLIVRSIAGRLGFVKFTPHVDLYPECDGFYPGCHQPCCHQTPAQGLSVADI